MTVPLPVGYRVVLDADACLLDEGTWLGGSPTRILRLTPAGRTGLAELEDGGVRTPRAGALARRLTDAGLMHPLPPRPSVTASVTVVIPVRDRSDLLANCLAALGTSHPILVVDDGSRDPAAVRAVATRHGAAVLRRPVNAGPAAARNDALALVTTDLVAFLDSDCEPTHGWLEDLLPHFADPLVGAVAPRIAPLTSTSATGRFAQAKSALDLGRRPGLVRPMSRVSYVPTAALVVRRAALMSAAHDGRTFDESLRYGEDVDLIWRLDAAGWRVRYVPEVTVRHREPTTFSALLARRFRYGTSAAPLSQRHPAAVAPLVLAPFAPIAVARLLRSRRVSAPVTAMRTLATAGHVANGIARYLRQFAGPLLVAAVLVPGGGVARRVVGGAMLFGPSAYEWVKRRPDLDPVRFALGDVADESAYGAGVIAGCVQRRTAVPLRPKLITGRK